MIFLNMKAGKIGKKPIRLFPAFLFFPFNQFDEPKFRR